MSYGPEFRAYMDSPAWRDDQEKEYGESNSGLENAEPKPWNGPKKPDILTVFVKEILSPIIAKEAEFVISDLRYRRSKYPNQDVAVKEISAEIARRITDAALVKAYDAHIALGQGGIEELKKIGRIEVAPDLPSREIINLEE